MDVTLDLITEEVISVDIVQEPHIDLTVVTGAPGSDGVGVIAGGTTGQVLAKASNANFDTVWEDPAAGTVASINGATGIVSLTQDSIPDGTTAKQYTATEKTKLAGIQSGAQVNAVSSVSGKTGAVTLAKGDVGLGNADNTSDVNKPVSTAQQTALNGKANTTHTHSESDITGLTSDLAAKAPLDSPAFTGTPTGITKSHVGLGNVDNTADTAKPVSTAQQTALDARLVWADGTQNTRPSTSSKVIWVGGTTQPTGMLTGDIWIKA